MPAVIENIHVRVDSSCEILAPMKKPTIAVQAEIKLKSNARRNEKPDSTKTMNSP